MMKNSMINGAIEDINFNYVFSELAREESSVNPNLGEPKLFNELDFFAELPNSSSISHEAESNENSGIYSDLVLDYISQMLMEEEMDDKFDMLESNPALEATEKPFYEIIGEKYPPSPDRPPLYSSPSSVGSEDHRNHDFHSSGITGVNGFTDNNPDPAYPESTEVLHSRIYSTQTSISLENGVASFLKGFERGPDDFSDLLFKTLPAFQFERGVEEALKFLPSEDKLVVDAGTIGLDLAHELKEDHVSIEGRAVNAKVRRQKDRQDINFDLEEQRSGKQSAISYEEPPVSSEMLEMVLLCNTEKLPEVITTIREAMQNEAASKNSSEITEVKEPGKGRKSRKRNQPKKEVVDLQNILMQCAQTVASGDHQRAYEMLRQIRQHSSPHGDAWQRLAHYVTDGIEARLAGTGSVIFNALVSKRKTASDVLKAYQVYLVASPLKMFSYHFSNQTILNAIGNATRVHILDYGVYFGFQWPPFLKMHDSVSKEVSIVESIGGRSCKNDCSGRGVCNRDTGQCRCFHGYSGEGCSENLQFDCNLPSSPENPFGRWLVSTCPAYCDKTRAMCFCGEGTKYPYRPVAEACGFRLNMPSEPGGPKIADWSKDDLENVYTTNGSRHGWCNIDPEEAYANKVKFKEECDCKYDGQLGRFCEIPTECSCINQCSGHGYCRGGACQCDRDWYGIDCSNPSVLSLIKEWPPWLRPSTVEVSNKATFNDDFAGFKAVVKKKRPLIYVYDLPPDFNSHLLEGRHFRFECVNRIYTEKNRTLWTSQLYGAQMALYESILASSHRTMNAEEADFFFVPVLDSCIITRADDAPHISLEHMGLRSALTLDFYKKAYEYITLHYPYWNHTSGKDHIWFFAWDEGACYAPKEIWNSMMLVHWGNTNTKHNRSTTAYWGDIWDSIPSSRRGNHPCFDPEKDLVLPAWKRPEPGAIWLKLWARPLENRTTLFYFNGNLGPAYQDGRTEDAYSMGIRQKLAAEFGSTPNKKGELGRQHTSDVTVTPLRSSNYFEELASSIFCGVLPGDGWSGRMEDSILQGCVPVIIQDGIFLPYENILNYRSFAVRITEDEIPNLVKILQGINKREVEFMLANVRQIWQRFLYLDSILLEANRQRSLFSDEEDWAVEFSKLGDDDVFTTFIQILHYKLHNDPWRRHLDQKKDYGLPKSCLRRTS